MVLKNKRDGMGKGFALISKDGERHMMTCPTVRHARLACMDGCIALRGCRARGYHFPFNLYGMVCKAR